MHTRSEANPIVLSGFMAVGKSTVGARLASRLGIPFVDTDRLLERTTGLLIHELWNQEGEGRFRLREASLALSLLRESGPKVIAFGGGTVTRKDVRREALRRGTLFTLTATPDTVLARTPDLHMRPNLSVGSPRERAEELLAERHEAYAECHAAIETDGRTPDEIVDLLVAELRHARLVVPFGTRSHRVHITHNTPNLITDVIAGVGPSKVFAVVDASLKRLWHERIEKTFSSYAFPVTQTEVRALEEHKTLAHVSALWDMALASKVDRDTVVVAMGGGIVGDLAGFVASTLLRGLRWVNVPTTLLSMVDASLGGKTGMDHPLGKNLLGSIWQPTEVVLDLSFLETLPEREFRAGLSEVVKIAAVSDRDLFEWLEARARDLTQASSRSERVFELVVAAAAAKIALVEEDEREEGRRVLLNFGHTFGHGIEAATGYRGLLHGEAVAIGMVAEQRAAEAMDLSERGLANRLEALLTELGLPTKPVHGQCDAALRFVAHDKKMIHTENRIRLPVLREIGVAHVARASHAKWAQAVHDTVHT